MKSVSRSRRRYRQKPGPNRLEMMFDLWTPDSVRFVGDGVFQIRLANGKIKRPDFVVTGTNKLIEIYGDYWHRGEDPSGLIGLYRLSGYDCLVLWESELRTDRENTLSRVAEFLGKSRWQTAFTALPGATREPARTRKVQVPLRIPEQTKRSIEALAIAGNKSQQRIVADALDRYLKVNAESVKLGLEILHAVESVRKANP